MNVKIKVVRLFLFLNIILIFMKLIVGIFIGLVSIILEVIYLIMDLFVVIIVFFFVKILDIFVDDIYFYGYGKVENIFGVIELLFIFVVFVWIIVEVIKKIFNFGDIEFVGIGFIVMFVLVFINLVVFKKLYKVVKEEDLIVLEVDVFYLKVDVYIFLGVGIGLFFIWFIGLNYLDLIVVIVVVIFILKEFFELLKFVFNFFLDVKLFDEEIEIIRIVISKYLFVYCNYYDFKIRKFGWIRYIELYLVFFVNKLIKDVYDICDEIENDIGNVLSFI